MPWWPWCDDAFEEARARDVPVLISVGYSACHWCSVMAHESFEDREVAAALRGGFVSVKVDREERPDVDALYMEAVQIATGNGGWPMTVLALPDGRPFWAGTYLPKHRFLNLLHRAGELWAAERDTVEHDAARLTEAVRSGTRLPALSEGLPSGIPGGAGAGVGALGRCVEGMLARQDPEWGGGARGLPNSLSPRRWRPWRNTGGAQGTRSHWPR